MHRLITLVFLGAMLVVAVLAVCWQSAFGRMVVYESLAHDVWNPELPKELVDATFSTQDFADLQKLWECFTKPE